MLVKPVFCIVDTRSCLVELWHLQLLDVRFHFLPPCLSDPGLAFTFPGGINGSAFFGIQTQREFQKMYADKKWRNHLKRLKDEISLLALVLSLTLSSSDLPSSLELGPLINLFFLLLGQYSVSVELQTVISGHYWINVDLTRLHKSWNSRWVSICPRKNRPTLLNSKGVTKCACT